MKAQTHIVYKNSFYYMATSLLPMAVNFVVLPLFTRYLTPADYGTLALIQSFSAFLPLILGLQVQSSISRFYFDYTGQEQKVLISTIAAFISIAGILGTAIMLVCAEQILYTVFPRLGHNAILLFKLTIITAFFNMLTEFFKILVMVREKAKLFMQLSLSLFAFGLAVNIIEVMIFEKGAYGVVEATLILAIVQLIAFVFCCRSFLIGEFRPSLLINPIKFSLPVLPHAIAGIIFMYSDRIILEKYVSLSAIGLYALSDKIAMIFKTAVNQLNAAFLPYFFRTAANDRIRAAKDAQAIERTMVFYVSSAICLVAVFSVEIVYYILDKKFFNAWIMLPILASAYLFRGLYCFASSGIFFEKKTGIIAFITVLAAAVNIAINLLFIPVYGVMAAVFSTLISYMITYFMAVVLSLKIFYIPLNNKLNLVLIAYMYFVIIACSVINYNFTLQHPSLPLWMYGLKLIMVCGIIYIGWKNNTIYNIFGFCQKLKSEDSGCLSGQTNALLEVQEK